MSYDEGMRSEGCDVAGFLCAPDGNDKISTCTSTYRKSIYDSENMRCKSRDRMVENHYHLTNLLETTSAARELRPESLLTHYEHNLEHNLTSRKLFSLKELYPYDYLHLIQKYVPEELISSKNFTKIRSIAKYFSGSVTSFFGFESNLNKPDAQSDFLFAVSSKRGEREALADLINCNSFPGNSDNNKEWKQIRDFVAQWVDPSSILYDKVLGIWFEFDTNFSFSSYKMPVPSIFIHPETITSCSNMKEISKYSWLTKIAIPILTGKEIPDDVEQKIVDCIFKMPKGSVLFQVGTMLSRLTNDIRLVFKRMLPSQIVPYLKSIGWSDKEEGLSLLLENIQRYVSRVVLHITVREQVDPKIGIECSFYPDLYNLETRWSDFLDYLTENNICISKKKSALFNFSGVEQEISYYNFDPKIFIPAVKIPSNDFSAALVRYISHVKLVYQSNHHIEAKAYLGVRLFGTFNELTDKNLRTVMKNKN